MAQKSTPKVSENAVIRWAARAAGYTVANRGAIPGPVTAWWIAKGDGARQRLIGQYRAYVERYDSTPVSGESAHAAQRSQSKSAPRGKRQRVTAAERREALVSIADSLEAMAEMIENARKLVLLLIDAR